jgi:hypothetical protein
MAAFCSSDIFLTCRIQRPGLGHPLQVGAFQLDVPQVWGFRGGLCICYTSPTDTRLGLVLSSRGPVCHLRRQFGSSQVQLGRGSTFVSIKPSSRLGNSFSESGALGFSLLINGNIRIGVLPQIQENLVGLPCSSLIAHHLLRAAKLEPGQGSRDMSHGKTGIVDQLLELSRGRSAIAELQIP